MSHKSGVANRRDFMVWSERERGHMGSRECEMGSRVRMVPERPMNSPNAIFGIQLSIVKVFFF